MIAYTYLLEPSKQKRHLWNIYYFAFTESD